MSFLYPMFLLAGLALAIPVIIHLFDLRRYKVVYFPHTRFLKNIELRSRRSSKLRYKWLLALRLLFLAFMVFAFAQPFFRDEATADTGERLQLIYIDNSQSMSVKQGARSLLDVAKDAAKKQVRTAAPGTRFLLLTNDKPVSYKPLAGERVLAEIENIDFSANSKDAEDVLTTVQSLATTEAAPAADVYFYSDFQQNAFSGNAFKELKENVAFYGIPIQTKSADNIYIDTAFFNTPALQTAQPNELIVRTRMTGEERATAPVLQLSVAGQVKSAVQLNFDEDGESVDTLAFQSGNSGWQEIFLTVNDGTLRFDDTFRIAARSTPNLSVLVLNEGQPNPFIQAAFRAYDGFRLMQQPVGTQSNWQDYNMLVLNGITSLSADMGAALKTAMEQGKTICIFPAKTRNYNALNEGLAAIGDIRITGIDTAAEDVSSLQRGSELISNIFEKIPENVQLPRANWHYVIKAGLTANMQEIMAFRNGDPFLGRFTPQQGVLFLFSSSADMADGNFAGSYFFAPFLYQMAMQSHSGDIYALTAGSNTPAYLPLTNAGERNMVHLYGNGIDAIPPQRPDRQGLQVFAGQAVNVPGFYSLYAQGSDTLRIALNQNRSESQLAVWDIGDLRNNSKADNIHWVDISETGSVAEAKTRDNFPLWKVCAILALLMLAAETYVLAGGFRKQTVAAQ